jgi:hypothetical protein
MKRQFCMKSVEIEEEFSILTKIELEQKNINDYF